MRTLLPMAVALFIGGLLPLQGAINARLGKALVHPLQASFISFLGGTLALLLVLVLLRPELPSGAVLRSQPWYLFTGGLIGASFVTMVVVLAPTIGIANTLAATIAGQLILSVIFDHIGLLGLAAQPVSLPRVVGCIGLVVSLALIQRA